MIADHAVEPVRAHAAPHHYPHAAASTAYCQGGRTASGAQTAWGMVAQNGLRLGTTIVLRHPIAGLRRFRVMDRIGWGSDLDVFMTSCASALAYGRRLVHYRIAPGASR